MYRDSSGLGSNVATAGILVKTGMKWKAHKAVNRAEAQLQHSILAGYLAVGGQEWEAFLNPATTKSEKGRNVKWCIAEGRWLACTSKVAGQGGNTLNSRKLPGQNSEDSKHCTSMMFFHYNKPPNFINYTKGIYSNNVFVMWYDW